MKNISRCRAALALAALLGACALAPAVAAGAVVTSQTAPARAVSSGPQGGSLEAAATKAGNIGRAVAMSLIGLALAAAAVVLAFRRNFAEAVGVFAIGIVAVVLATPTGVSLLKNTVSSLFGG